MKVNVLSRNLPQLVFFVIPFLVIILFPTDTFATRVDVDVNNLNNYFSSLWPTTGNLNNDSFIITKTNNSRYRTGFRINSDIFSVLNCPDVNGTGSVDIYTRVVYGSGWDSSMFSSLGSSYVSGSYNSGIVYHLLINGSIAIVYENSDTNYLVPINVNYKFESLTLGCSSEEVAPASPTPTPTPTATPTATPTSEPSPTPTPEEIDPSEYEWNPVEDAIVKYRLISFVLIAAASLLLYHIIIKRVILK